MGMLVESAIIRMVQSVMRVTQEVAATLHLATALIAIHLTKLVVKIVLLLIILFVSER